MRQNAKLTVLLLDNTASQAQHVRWKMQALKPTKL